MSNSRFDYIEYDEKSYETHREILKTVKELENLIVSLILDDYLEVRGFTPENANKSKEYALAKLEEVFMHVGKAIKYDQTFIRGVPVTKLEKREKE